MKAKTAISLILTVLLTGIFGMKAGRADSGKLDFFTIRLSGDIDRQAERFVKLGLRKAAAAGADYVILDLDTYGGAVNSADAIRTAILGSKVPVLAFIDLQAASAGALISIACDSIYMKTGSSIGAATVVDGGGKVMPDKYQSFMRGMMRSTAEARGRNPHIAEQMVDTANVLSMTPSEAIAAGYCEGICESREDVAALVAGDRPYELSEMDMTSIEKAVHFMLNPILQAIFMIMIIGGIYIEFRTPGIGLPLCIALLGAVLYFSPLYIESLARNWEILLFVLGMILLAFELFVIPGFGVCGISGIVCVVLSLVFAAVDNSLIISWDGSINLEPALLPFCLVIISSSAALFGSLWIVNRLYRTKSFDVVALRESLDGGRGFVGVPVSGLSELVGSTVTVFNDLKPSGKVITDDGRIFEASLSYGYASRGEKVKVEKAEQGRLYCSTALSES